MFSQANHGQQLNQRQQLNQFFNEIVNNCQRLIAERLLSAEFLSDHNKYYKAVRIQIEKYNESQNEATERDLKKAYVSFEKAFSAQVTKNIKTYLSSLEKYHQQQILFAKKLKKEQEFFLKQPLPLAFESSFQIFMQESRNFLTAVKDYKNDFERNKHGSMFDKLSSVLDDLNNFENTIRKMEKSKDIYFEIVSKKGEELASIPVHLRTNKLCLAAVKNNFIALCYVPWPEISALSSEHKKIAIQGLKQNLKAILNLPKPDQGKLNPILKELYLYAVKSNGHALAYFTEPHDNNREDFKDIYLAALEQNGHALKHIPERELKLNGDLITAALRKTGLALKHVPIDLVTAKHFEMAVKADERALHIILDDPKLKAKLYDDMFIAPKDRYELFLTLVKQYGLSLNKIPPVLWTKDEYEKLKLCTKEEYENQIFTVDEYKTLCQTAVRQNGAALEFVPEKYITKDLCMDAVKCNGMALKTIMALKNFSDALTLDESEANDKNNKTHGKNIIDKDSDIHDKGKDIPNKDKDQDQDTLNEETKNKLAPLQKNLDEVKKNENEIINNLNEIVKTALEQNGQALEFIPREKRTLKRSIIAVEQTGKAFRHVRDRFRHEVLKKVPIKKILYQNYKIIKFLPKHDKKINTEIKDYLANIKHVVVTRDLFIDYDTGLKNIYDPELWDIFLVYANAPKRQDKTIHVDQESAEALLNDLEKRGAKNINLVLLDHANQNIEAMANLKPDQIATLVSTHDIIDRVTLLGCNTAKSAKLDEEKEMIKRFIAREKETKQQTVYAASGLILVSGNVDSSEYDKLFEKIQPASKKNKDEEVVVVNHLYILSQNVSNNKTSYSMIELTRDENKQILEQKYVIDEKNIDEMANTLVPKGKHQFPFPGENSKERKYLRGGKGAQLLNEKELIAINKGIDSVDIFDPNHPKYKQHKTIYPFISSVTASDKEIGKLKNSILQRVVAAIQQSKLGRPVMVKGYAQALHVDTEKKRMHVYRTHLYPHEYTRSQFFTGAKNINETKLKHERDLAMSKMIENTNNPDKEEDTQLKSIKVIVK